MSSAADRLKLARKQRYPTAVAAAEALGLPEQTYLPWESGRTGFTHRAALLADFFQVNLEWLLNNRGPMKKHGAHPVLERFERIPAEKQQEALDFMDFLARKTG